MNKNILLEALEVLRTRVKDSMDASDAHFSYFHTNKLKEIDKEINNLNEK